MSHASQQYAFTEPRTVKRAQVKPSEREHQTSSSAPRVSLAPAADRTLDILEFIASNGQTQAATLARELGIPRSTVYQLLEILERHGLVTRLAEQRVRHRTQDFRAGIGLFSPTSCIAGRASGVGASC